MMDKFRDYFSSIGVPAGSPLVDALWKSVIIAEVLSGEKVTEIMLSSNRIEGRDEFGTMYMFSDSFLLEAKSKKAGEFHVDVTLLKNSVSYCEVHASDFDPGDTNNNAKMVVKGELRAGISFRFDATGRNCRHLWDVVLAHIKPNLVRSN